MESSQNRNNQRNQNNRSDDPYDVDIDDENDWKALDSDDDDPADENDGDVLRDDDVDLGFRSHQFQYGSHGRNRNRSRQENQDEALYGVFAQPRRRRRGYPNDNDDDAGPAAAPVFVPASRKEHENEPSPSHNDDNHKAAPGFVPATKPDTTTTAPVFVAALTNQPTTATTTTTAAATTTTTTPHDPLPEQQPEHATTETTTRAKQQQHSTQQNQPVEEAEEDERRIRREQAAADDRFRSLLEQAKARNSRSRTAATRSSSSNSTKTNERGELGEAASPQPQQEQHEPLGLPSSFGFAPPQGGGLGGIGIGASAPVATKDPKVATWEKHTKGFGSKLLAKMGWKGSGGLGSNRVRRRVAPKPSAVPPTETSSSNNNNSSSNDTAAELAPATTATKATKGISRPLEVVVRPSNMGLGFGNFKEASQLKANRRIEAEVRGIDYDAQQHEARKRKRAERRKKYGNSVQIDDYDVGSDDDDGDNENENSPANAQSSAIPSTSKLLSEQSWKAGRFRSRKQRKTSAATPEIIPYEELLARRRKTKEGSAPVVIDLRGPSSSKTSPDGPVPLGEELLYNLSFVLGTYENKLHSAAYHHEAVTRKQLEGLERSIESAKARSATMETRQTQLARVLAAVATVRKVLRSSASPEDALPQGHALVDDLQTVFGPSEQEELQFWRVVAPTLLGPILQAMLDGWKPLGTDNNHNTTQEKNQQVVDGFFRGAHRSADHRSLCESLVQHQLLPKLKEDVEAQTVRSQSGWDPVTNPYAFLDLYECLMARARELDQQSTKPNHHHENERDDPHQIFPSGEDDEVSGPEASSFRLADEIRQELILQALFPRLQTAVSDWKPLVATTTDKAVSLRNPLHLWVLPWLPHIDHPGLLPNLLMECRRKLKSSLSVLGRHATASPNTLTNDRIYVAAVLEILGPWKTLLGPRAIPKLLSDDSNFFPRLERLLRSDHSPSAHHPPRYRTEDSDRWESLQLVLSFHGSGLIADTDFVSLLEGPVLVSWARAIHARLRSGRTAEVGANESQFSSGGNSVLSRAVASYREYKGRVLVDPLSSSPSPLLRTENRSVLLLRGDEYICRIFYSVLRMMEIYQEEEESSTALPSSSSSSSSERQEEFNRLEPLESQGSFFTAKSRRSMEAVQESAYAPQAKETKSTTKYYRRTNELTFREVVERFASERGIVFRPGARTEDGKQIYLFGDRTIYLDDDVVFCRGNGGSSSWEPISLDQLGEMG